MKHDIEFRNPFQFSLDIVETEEKNLPSIGCNIAILFELPRSTFEYKATEIWFECSVLDQFEESLKELYEGEDVKPELYDIDREIVYSFNKEKITISIQRTSIEKGTVNMEISCDFEPEIVILNIESIRKFSKWW